MRIKVWEAAIRIFHWSLVLVVLGLFITSWQENQLLAHAWLGHGLLALVVFRLGWGFLGNEYARFGNFLKGPKVVATQVRLTLQGANPRFLGHNPAAGWMFVAMLGAMMFLVATGMVILGGVEEIGHWANLPTALAAPWVPWHRWAAYLLLAMAALHVTAAIKESRHQKENLPLAMIHGVKEQRENQPEPQAQVKPGWRALFLFGLLAGLAAVLVYWPLESRNHETRLAKAGVKSEAISLYSEECGSCHFEFPANLLPRRSWQAMMTEQGLADHFGEDASLDEESRQGIEQYLLQGAMEQSRSEAAFYLGREFASQSLPLRVTSSSWWKKRHEEVEPQHFQQKNVGSKLNCQACHRHAAFGSFEDADIRIPHPLEAGVGVGEPTKQ